jgi:hypothetical protein
MVRRCAALCVLFAGFCALGCGQSQQGATGAKMTFDTHCAKCHAQAGETGGGLSVDHAFTIDGFDRAFFGIDNDELHVTSPWLTHTRVGIISMIRRSSIRQLPQFTFGGGFSCVPQQALS